MGHNLLEDQNVSEGERIIKLLESIDGRIGWLCRLMEDIYHTDDKTQFEGQKIRKEVSQSIEQIVNLARSHPAVKDDPQALDILNKIPMVGGTK